MTAPTDTTPGTRAAVRRSRVGRFLADLRDALGADYAAAVRERDELRERCATIEADRDRYQAAARRLLDALDAIAKGNTELVVNGRLVTRGAGGRWIVRCSDWTVIEVVGLPAAVRAAMGERP